MSDFRRFCIAFAVFHGLLSVAEAMAWAPDTDFPKRALVAAGLAISWVAIFPLKWGPRA